MVFIHKKIVIVAFAKPSSLLALSLQMTYPLSSKTCRHLSTSLTCALSWWFLLLIASASRHRRSCTSWARSLSVRSPLQTLSFFYEKYSPVKRTSCSRSRVGMSWSDCLRCSERVAACVSHRWRPCSGWHSLASSRAEWGRPRCPLPPDCHFHSPLQLRNHCKLIDLEGYPLKGAFKKDIFY